MNPARDIQLPSWWLSSLADQDSHSPGLLGSLIRSSAHRRHVAALCVSSRRCLGTYDDSNSPGNNATLATGRLEDLITEWRGSCPTSIVAALGRMADRIESRSFYNKLFSVFSNPAHRDVARALQHVVEINETMLDVANSAPAIVLRTGAFRAISSVRQRRDVMAAIGTIYELTAANPTSMYQSLRELAAHGNIVNFVDSWLSKASFPSTPVPPGDEIIHISTASELHRVATEFENCLASFRLDVLCGREAFYECRTPFGPMVARIGRDDTDQPWEFLGTHARQNRVPPRDACAWTEARFAEIGIRLPVRRGERPEKWQVFERLLDPWYEDFEDLVLDEVLAA